MSDESKVKVSEITLEFEDGTKMKLSLERARQIHSALDSLLCKRSDYWDPTHWYPTYPIPTFPYQDWHYCQSGSELVLTQGGSDTETHDEGK